MKYILISLTFLLLACQSEPLGTKSDSQSLTNDPLPSWNEGKVKSDIVAFVTRAADPGNPGFIPVADRIAVFDNDGTLWSEQPMYFQLFFAIDRVKALAPEHTEWKDKQPFKAILENDRETLGTFGIHELLEIVMASHAGNTTTEFETLVRDWITTAKHPQLDRHFTDLVYQPMLELLDYLRANDFKTFIVSGGGIEFMRPWVEEVYGIPRDQVVGSTIKTEFILKDGEPKIVRLPELDFIDDKEGKPVAINKFIGRKPVFCAGNSDGDLAMMQWTASNTLPSMMLYIHHTDADREWAYDRESHIGHFDKGLDEAISKGWSLMSMKDDWNVIYPFEITAD